MKLLIDLDRWIGKVESFFLAASLIAMLFLTIYSVAYRNLVAPLVLKMQASEMNAAEPLPEAAPVATAPTAAPAPAAAPPLGAVPAPSAGDLDEEPATPAARAATPAGQPIAVAAPSAGDLDDDPAPAAPAAAPAGQPGAVAAPSAGDLDDDPAPAAPAAAPAGQPGAVAAPSAGDLEDEPGTAPSPAPAAAPSSAPAPANVAAAPAPVASRAIPQDSTLLKAMKAFNFGWIDKVTLHLLLWVGFFGAAIAASKRKHIKIDAFSRVLPKAFRERLQIVLDVFAATACLFLARAALQFMASETASGAMFYGPVPGWVGIVIIPVGFGLLIWHFLFDAAMEIALAAGVRSPELEAWHAGVRQSEEEVV